MAIIRSFSGLVGGGIPVDNRIGITKGHGKDVNLNDGRITGGDGKEGLKKMFGDYLSQSAEGLCSFQER